MAIKYLNQFSFTLISVLLIIEVVSCGKNKDKGCPELDELDSPCAFASMCPSCPCSSPCATAIPTMAPMMPMVPMVPPVMGMMAAAAVRRAMTQAMGKAIARAAKRVMRRRIFKRSSESNQLLEKIKMAAATRDIKDSNILKVRREREPIAQHLETKSLISVPTNKRALRVRRQMPMLPNPMQIMMVAMMIMNMIYPGLGNFMYNAMAYGTAMARLKKTKKMAKKAAKRDWKEGKMRIMLRFMNGQLPVQTDFAENAYSTYEFPTMQGQMEVPSVIPGAGQMGLADYLGILQMLNGAKRRR